MAIITLSHGSGGKRTNNLVNDIFYRYFYNDILLQKNDSSILPNINGSIAVTTDSFVIKPIIFSGGDIGKLSICGTVNDLAVSGATPLYITSSFIIEEGFELTTLEMIVKSMAETAKHANVNIIAGDTKVVERGSLDNIFINTTGIGVIESDELNLSNKKITKGDKIIINGTIGDHGMCILNAREGLKYNLNIDSDCCCLNDLAKDILSASNKVKLMRDPTRGGLATTLNEISISSNYGIMIYEEEIPIKKQVYSMCNLLGFDPLFIANEGKLVVVVDKEDAATVLKTMKKHTLGKEAKIIGEVIDDKDFRVYMRTNIGGTRVVNMLEGEIVPRIC